MRKVRRTSKKGNPRKILFFLLAFLAVWVFITFFIFFLFRITTPKKNPISTMETVEDTRTSNEDNPVFDDWDNSVEIITIDDVDPNVNLVEIVETITYETKNLEYIQLELPFPKIRYPEFKKKTFESEIYEHLPRKITHNCFYCDFPEYEKIFEYRLHHDTALAWVTAFTTNNGEILTILTHSPEGFFQVSEKFIIEVKLLHEVNNQLKVELIECDDPVLSYHTKIVEYRCSIKDFPELLKTCFKIQIYHRGRRVLPHALNVRQCHLKDGERINELSMCSTVSSKSNRFLLEWIEYHRMIGIEKFYIYLSPGIDGVRKLPSHASKKIKKEYYENLYFSPTYVLLDHYIEDGIVNLYPWNYTFERGDQFRFEQLAAMTDCIRRHGDRMNFVAMVDNDEFIVPGEGHDDITFLLQKYEKSNIASLGLGSYTYGMLRKIGSKYKNTIDIYPMYLEPLWNIRKMIIVPQNVPIWYNHYVLGLPDNTSLRINLDDKKEARIAHYFYRKNHEFNEELTTKYRKKYTEYVFNDEEESRKTMISRFSGKVRKRVKRSEERVNGGINRFHFEYSNYIPVELNGTTVNNPRLKTKCPTCCSHMNLNEWCCPKGDTRVRCRTWAETWCNKKIFTSEPGIVEDNPKD